MDSMAACCRRPGLVHRPHGDAVWPVNQVLITFVLPNGEEREERWPSIAAFRGWAVTRDQRLDYTAYREDEDGEWIVLEKGRISGSTNGSAQ
jgi:hypothetical protein